LLGFVLRSKRNVMYRTGCDAAHRSVGLTKEVDNSTRSSVVRGFKPKPVPDSSTNR
jgi:hypothetical protein